MLRSKHRFRKADPLLLLAAVVALGVVISTSVQAGDEFSLSPSAFTDRVSVMLTRANLVAGRDNVTEGFQFSMRPPPDIRAGMDGQGKRAGGFDGSADIYLSWRLRW